MTWHICSPFFNNSVSKIAALVFDTRRGGGEQAQLPKQCKEHCEISTNNAAAEQKMHFGNGGGVSGNLREQPVGGKKELCGWLSGPFHTEQHSAVLIWLHKDHLGFVEAMTDAWGDMVSVNRMSFDPWGAAARSRLGYDNLTGGDPEHYLTTRGFTGHEMLDQKFYIQKQIDNGLRPPPYAP